MRGRDTESVARYFLRNSRKKEKDSKKSSTQEQEVVEEEGAWALSLRRSVLSLLFSLFSVSVREENPWGLRPECGPQEVAAQDQARNLLPYSWLTLSLPIGDFSLSLFLSFFTLCVHRRQTGRRVETWQETFPKDTAVIEKRKLREEQSLFDPYSGISPKTQL